MRDVLEQLSGRLLIQCRPGQARVAAEVADAHDAGLVLTGRSLESAVRHLRERGFGGPILCDADRYSGRRRVGAGRGIHPGWCRRQQELGLLPLTDSGYLGKRNWVGLRTVLRAAGRQPHPTVAMLPLAARWFATPAVCAALIREINKYNVPVAIAIEHCSDPFGPQYVVRGFVRLVREAEVPVLLLRSDGAALGAWCHGAQAVAIGTGSALRHIYPIAQGRVPPRPGISAFVSPLLGYHQLETVARVVAGTPHLHQLWPCGCPVCEDRTPDRLAEADDPAIAAFQHSLHAQLRLASQLLRARGRAAMISSWHDHCSHAAFVHEQLAEVVDRWRTPAAVRSWLAVTDDPIPERTAIPAQWRVHEPRHASFVRQRNAE